MSRLLSVITLTIGLIFVGGCFNRPTDPQTVKGSAFDRMKPAENTKTDAKGGKKADKRGKGIPD
jgi:hypothetical protein